MDDAIGRQVLAVVQPAAVEAAVAASKEQMQEENDAIAALQRDLEAARYAASERRGNMMLPIRKIAWSLVNSNDAGIRRYNALRK